MFNNTSPDGYILDVAGHMHPNDPPELSPSGRVVRALQALDSRVVTSRFRSTVLEAIFHHAVGEQFNPDDEEYGKKLILRLERRYGKKRTRELLIERCDVLNTWRYRDARFIPD